MHPAKLAISPEFSEAARSIAASLADFGISFDHVRIRLRNNPDTTVTVLDTTVAFSSSSSAPALDLTVPVETIGQTFNALIEYVGPNGPVYAGTILLQSYAPGEEPPKQQSRCSTSSVRARS
jgi:hypothetical protein